MQADCIFIRRSARFIVRRRTFGGFQTNLKPVSCATISFSNGAQNMHASGWQGLRWRPARPTRLKNTDTGPVAATVPLYPCCATQLKQLTKELTRLTRNRSRHSLSIDQSLLRKQSTVHIHAF